MMFGRRGSARLAFLPVPREDEADPARTAWRIYDALADWIGKVDAKASYALTIESGALAGVIALAQPGYRLSLRAGTVTFMIGVALLGAGALTAICVVMPRLTSQKTLRRESSLNYVYFGHLRFWNPGDLEGVLRNDCILPALCRAVIVMSDCAWKKYRLMQLSMVLSAMGAAVTIPMLLGSR
jgi:Pycsar effector protein